MSSTTSSREPVGPPRRRWARLKGAFAWLEAFTATGSPFSNVMDVSSTVLLPVSSWGLLGLTTYREARVGDWWLVLILLPVVLAVLVVFAVREQKWRQPHAAIGVVLASVTSLVGLFALSDWVASVRVPGCFNVPLSRVDAAYFAVTTFTTTGYGDLHAMASTCRLIVAVQIGVGFTVTAVLIVVCVARWLASRADRKQA